MATYTKAPHERVCAAARKIRCELGVDTVPVTRPTAVMMVVDALDDNALPGSATVRTWRLAQHLMHLGDQVPVGPGTSRLTIAAATSTARIGCLPRSISPKDRSRTQPVRSCRRRRIGSVGTTASSSTFTKPDTEPKTRVSSSNRSRTPCAERITLPFFLVTTAPDASGVGSHNLTTTTEGVVEQFTFSLFGGIKR